MANGNGGSSFKDWFSKSAPWVVGIGALLSGVTASKVTDVFRQYEHLELVHGVGAALTVIILYLLAQAQRLPDLAKRMAEHSDELKELTKGYVEMISLNKAAGEDRVRLVKLVGKIEELMESERKVQCEINNRLARLEGRLEGPGRK